MMLWLIIRRKADSDIEQHDYRKEMTWRTNYHFITHYRER